jgi:hypothetical protein
MKELGTIDNYLLFTPTGWKLQKLLWKAENIILCSRRLPYMIRRLAAKTRGEIRYLVKVTLPWFFTKRMICYIKGHDIEWLGFHSLPDWVCKRCDTSGEARHLNKMNKRFLKSWMYKYEKK